MGEGKAIEWIVEHSMFSRDVFGLMKSLYGLLSHGFISCMDQGGASTNWINLFGWTYKYSADIANLFNKTISNYVTPSDDLQQYRFCSSDIPNYFDTELASTMPR